MKIRAEFYSRLKEIVGTPSLEITMPDGATVQDLVATLSSDYPPLRDFQDSLLFGIDVEFVDKKHVLRDGEMIAVMPPVQGG